MDLLLRHWWNNRTSKLPLQAGSFLSLCNIPRRLGAIKSMVWKANIYAMLQHIPILISLNENDNDNNN